MKAIVQYRYGTAAVLESGEVEMPEIGDDQVLLRVEAAGVNPADWAVMSGLPYVARPVYGLRRPKAGVRGTDVSGTVEAVGSSVTRFKPGDEVFGSANGSYAEYAAAAEDQLAPKPANLTFEQAAAVPMAGQVALQALRGIQSGQKVLVNGASGGIGTFAVQIAKSLGADVTGVCSAKNVEMVRSLGADHVIDYTQGDFTQSGQKYDLIFQLAGTSSPSDCRRVLSSKGTLVLSSGESDGRWIGPVGRLIKAVVLSPFVSQRLGSFLAKPNKDDLQFLKELIEAGKLTPVIDRTYSLSEVPEAIRYLEEGHARGKIVITVGTDG